MEQVLERKLSLAGVEITLATVQLSAVTEFVSPETHYFLCQRLSQDHAPLRIGKFAVAEAFPRARSVGFLPPGCSLNLYPMAKSFHILNCGFEREYFEQTTQFDQSHWENFTGALVSIRDQRIEILMQEIYSELVQLDFGSDIVIAAAGEIILVELARYARQLKATSMRVGSSQGLAPWQLRRIHERIDASLEQGYPTLNELAKVCNISASHLMRSFKASTGWQLHKFIAEERLKAAKVLLDSEAYSSKEIALRLGFGSAAYFATAFRRMTGLSPTEYRNRNYRQSGSDRG